MLLFFSFLFSPVMASASLISCSIWRKCTSCWKRWWWMVALWRQVNRTSWHQYNLWRKLPKIVISICLVSHPLLLSTFVCVPFHKFSICLYVKVQTISLSMEYWIDMILCFRLFLWSSFHVCLRFDHICIKGIFILRKADLS